MVGCRNKRELRVLERFLRRLRIVTLNEAIANTGVTLLRRYRLSHGLLIADALIAATALTVDNPLVTKNQRDYRFIEALELLPYPQAFA
jgi:predicted nucleic acid-binding protein